MAWSTPSTVTTGDLITAATWNQDIVNNTIALTPTGWTYHIDGGGATISTGCYIGHEVPYKCDVTGITVSGSPVGSACLDIYKSTYANLPSACTDNITNNAGFMIASAVAYQNTTLTGWTKAITAFDWLDYAVKGASAITQLSIAVRVNRS